MLIKIANFAHKLALSDRLNRRNLWLHLEHWQATDGDELNTFATITTEANQQLAPIQPRVPVIIEKADWPVWLGEVEGDVPGLLRPAPEAVLRLWLADKRVGNVKNNGPALLAPACARETAQPALGPCV
jgi:putative SOS response-associated peptidase YedK